MIIQAGILTLFFGAVCLLLGTQLRDLCEVCKEINEEEGNEND